jgi:hypothetical protein
MVTQDPNVYVDSWDQDIFKREQQNVDDDYDENKKRVPWDGSQRLRYVTDDRKKIAEQARALLKGTVKWEPQWQVLKRQVPGLKKAIRLTVSKSSSSVP